jgi:hypothetical protein
MISWEHVALAMLRADNQDGEGTVLDLGTDNTEQQIERLHYLKTIAEAAIAEIQKGDAAQIGQRAAHYGSGVQPWDHIKEMGWGPEFAAGNALKYVRRYKNKNGDDDLNKGRWYYRELIEMALGDAKMFPQARAVLDQLSGLLTEEERGILRA